MKNLIPAFLRGARTYPQGGVVGRDDEFTIDREAFLGKNDAPEPSDDFAERSAFLRRETPDLYKQQPRDQRLKIDLAERRRDLLSEEGLLVEEINDRLIKLQATRKAVRAIDAAGAIIVAEEEAYKPVMSSFQNRMPKPATKKTTLEHVDTNGKVEAIVIDEAELEAAMQDDTKDYAKAC